MKLEANTSSFTRSQKRVLTVRLLVGGVMLFSGLSKALSPAAGSVFLSQLGIPATLNVSLIYFVIFLELFLGACCMLGIFLRIASIAIAGTLIVFACAILLALLMGITGSCGCFGNVITSEVGVLAILRNLVVAAFALYLAGSNNNRLCLQAAIDRL